VQIGTNSKPASDDTCTDRLFWAAHDANYNVIALLEPELYGYPTHLVERLVLRSGATSQSSI